MQDDYFQGLSEYYSGNYKDSLPFFKNALQHSSKMNPHYAMCLSYYGLALMFIGDRTSGLEKCQKAANTELKNSDVYYNLAIASRLNNNRKLTLDAIDQGLLIQSNNENLIRLRKIIGQRRKPKISILSRNNILNIILGKITYKNN